MQVVATYLDDGFFFFFSEPHASDGPKDKGGTVLHPVLFGTFGAFGVGLAFPLGFSLLDMCVRMRMQSHSTNHKFGIPPKRRNILQCFPVQCDIRDTVR